MFPANCCRENFVLFSDEEKEDYTGGIPSAIFKLKNLKFLDLSYQVRATQGMQRHKQSNLWLHFAPPLWT